MKIKFNKINLSFLVLLLFIFLQSCETITGLPNKVLETGSEAADYVGSIFSSDEEEAIVSEDEDDQSVILGAPKPETQSVNNDQLTNDDAKVFDDNTNASSLKDSEQVLEAVPSDDYEINNLAVKNEKDEIKSVDYEENKSKDNSNQVDINLFEKKSLVLRNKVQFKIATINFRSGSSSIEGKDILKIKKVMKLAKEKNARVRIVGHASTRTKDMPPLNHKLANFNISDKRSQAVAQIFLKNKFPASMLITEAVSDSKPLFHESMPAGTFGNQRTEIFIIY
mgnify:CR=1 FL=1